MARDLATLMGWTIMTLEQIEMVANNVKTSMESLTAEQIHEMTMAPWLDLRAELAAFAVAA